MSSMISVSEVTCRPALLACAMTGPASWVTTTAGARVSSGARTDRKTTSSKTTMNTIDRSRPRLSVRWLARLASAVQAAGQRAGPDGVTQAGDQMLGGAIAAKVDAGQDLQLRRLTIAADAEVLDLPHVGYLRQAAGQPADGGHVRRGEPAAAADDN